MTSSELPASPPVLPLGASEIQSLLPHRYPFLLIDLSLIHISIPNIDREKRTVGINLQVVPGPRVMVRQITFKGNTRTTDEVLRREMRQFEGSWYSQAAIDRSKVRLQRLGFFESGSVEAQTVPVPGSNDQVDVVFNVKETTSGSFTFGFGYSQLSGLTTTLQLSQNNFLGTGNQISTEIQRNAYLQRYSFSFLNPYCLLYTSRCV